MSKEIDDLEAKLEIRFLKIEDDLVKLTEKVKILSVKKDPKPKLLLKRATPPVDEDTP